eukprot:2934105-Pyramimonas_sp.AAC.1
MLEAQEGKPLGHSLGLARTVNSPLPAPNSLSRPSRYPLATPSLPSHCPLTALSLPSPVTSAHVRSLRADLRPQSSSHRM